MHGFSHGSNGGSDWAHRFTRDAKALMVAVMQNTKLADMTALVDAAESKSDGPTPLTPAREPARTVVALTVNGDRVETRAATLFDLLADLGYGNGRVATAVNGEFVPERARASRRLAAADAVEIVAPRQGG